LPVHINVKVACDVKNLLYGKNGAARVYAPQKGADDKMVEELENGIINFAAVVKNDLGIDISKIEGGGAAGGLGAGCIAFLNAELVSGIDLVMQLASLEDHISDCDLIITGEGKIDNQSLQGKVISGVGSLAKKHDKKLIAVCGDLTADPSQLKLVGVDSAYPILRYPIRLQEAMENAAQLLEHLSFTIGASI